MNKPLRNLMRFGKAFASNQLAGLAPSLYVRLTAQTGRGRGETGPQEIADYFEQCFDDYAEQLGMDRAAFANFLKGKEVLEYGPGDVLGMALLLHAHGAARVVCVDRFALEKLSPTNAAVYRALIERLPEDARERACKAFREPGKPESGFVPVKVEYRVSRDGLAGTPASYDLIISRAVLEHVNRLDRSLADIAVALRPDGVSVHCVDLRSHGLDRSRPLDFLSWPDVAYRLMYSNKGFPNRWRLDKYRQGLAACGLAIERLEPTELLEPQQVADLADALAVPFRHVSHEDLRWLGFWMVVRHAKPRASSPKKLLKS